MKLLIKTAFQHGRHYLLLLVALAFLVGVTLTSQVEMMSVGVITNPGALFSNSGDTVTEQGQEAISPQSQPASVAKRGSRNPLQRVMVWVRAHFDWMGNLTLLAGALVLVAILRGICVFGSAYVRQLVVIRVGRDLRQNYFDHIQALPMRFYHKHNVGTLSCRAYEDAYQISEAIQAGMTTYVQTPFTVLSSLLICCYISLQLSLVVFIAFPLLILPIIYFSKKVKHVSRRLLRNHEGVWNLLHQFLAGSFTIKLFSMERYSRERYAEKNDEMARLEERSARYGFMARPVMHMASTIMLATIILYGLYIARLEGSEIIVFCGMVYLMYEPIKRFNDENIKIQRGIAAAERMDEVMRLPTTDPKAAEGDILAEIRDSIEFDKVSFRYGDQWVLRDLSFTVKKGEAVALVGPTGAGKSTLAQLLPRIYEVDEGEIRIDGRSIAKMQLQSLREKISFVPQRPFLFIDSIRDNIAVGRNVSDEQVERAAGRAHAIEFIDRFPERFERKLTADMGGDLSGGQQQRLIIARALVKESPILILDEATSALDSVSEEQIKRAIEELRGDVTQLIIAHRLSTIENVDRILYLEEGRLVAQGTKDELLATCPAFRRMWESARVSAPDRADALATP